jgi:hypothetical protein
MAIVTDQRYGVLEERFRRACAVNHLGGQLHMSAMNTSASATVVRERGVTYALLIAFKRVAV